MDLRAWAANNLAARLLAEPWTPEAIGAAIDSVLGPVHPRTHRALVVRLVALGDDRPRPSPQSLAAFLIGSAFFRPVKRRPLAVVLDAPRFAPVAALAELRIPALSTPEDLADWLQESPDQLDWLANASRTHRRAEPSPLRHYHYALIGKSGGRIRLVEAPKARLKTIQRQILRDILYAVPVHGCAHGFVPGRSCLGGAQVHASEAVVMTFDLAEFFASIHRPRVQGLFRSLGYPWAVSRQLAGLCTTATPESVFLNLPAPQRPEWSVRALYRAPHLPQGAPTSPALANLLSWKLDRRLHGLARAVGANYTRYADDLAFSGDETLARGWARLCKAVETIVQEEGFSLNADKTRLMPRSGRQRVTGVVVNDHCNTGRAEFETLKAILHNCAHTGPASQNRSAHADFRRHLDGRVAWIEQVNLLRGAKLRRLFDRIAWSGVAAQGEQQHRDAPSPPQ